MSNNTLTWDMLYHPRLINVYNYFHNTTFAISTILTALALFIVHKKSSKAMGFYKYILISNLITNYVLDLVYFLIRPVYLLPYLIFYSDGIFKNLNPDYFLYLYYVFFFTFFWMYASWVPALLYRISKVFPGSKFYNMLNTPKRFFMMYVCTLLYMESIFSGNLFLN